MILLGLLMHFSIHVKIIHFSEKLKKTLKNPLKIHSNFIKILRKSVQFSLLKNKYFQLIAFILVMCAQFYTKFEVEKIQISYTHNSLCVFYFTEL